MTDPVRAFEPIRTERLLLREPRLEDAAPLMAVFGDPEAMRYIGDGNVRTLEQIQESMAKRIALLEARGHTMWTVQHLSSGEVLGDCGIIPIAWKGPEIELGYRFRPSAWGRGYATEASRAALTHFRSLGTGIDPIAVTDTRNDASGKVLQKIGFVFAGRTDAYYGETLHLYRLSDDA
ncbi:MAG: GNAT family N-acetyltransferase [Planctomycetota bacterium]